MSKPININRKINIKSWTCKL